MPRPDKFRHALVLKISELAQLDAAKSAKAAGRRAQADFHTRNAHHVRAQGRELLYR
jgi:hypothetical protein